MVSTLDINSALYRLVNVPAITDEISGKVYIGGFKYNDQLENITINTLENPTQYLQNGFMNLNVYVPQSTAGAPPLARFTKIIDILMPLVLDTKYDKSFLFQIDDDTGMSEDPARDAVWFVKRRLDW